MTDQIIIKRFQELEDQAKDIEATKKPTSGGFGTDTVKFHEWSTSVLNILQRVFGEDSVHYRNFHQAYKDYNGWYYQYEVCKGVFNSARSDYQGGYLFRLRSLISAEVLSDALDQAEELLRAKYKDAACVIAGIALETAIRTICTKMGIPLGKLDKMNTDLCKAGLYNVGMQKQITAWADRRNNAAHGNWSTYNEDDVQDLIKGANRFIAEYL